MPAYRIHELLPSTGIICRSDRLKSSAREIPIRAASFLAASYSCFVKLTCVRIMITSLAYVLSDRCYGGQMLTPACSAVYVRGKFRT